MTETEIKQIVDIQRNYFNTGATLPSEKIVHECFPPELQRISHL